MVKKIVAGFVILVIGFLQTYSIYASILHPLSKPTSVISSNPSQDFDYVGIASWYSDALHGRVTANGEFYDKGKMTAAHLKLPFGTILNVTNLSNGKTVQVIVNDRGPYYGNRILDLSRISAHKLGFITRGITKVGIQIVTYGIGHRHIVTREGLQRLKRLASIIPVTRVIHQNIQSVDEFVMDLYPDFILKG